MSFISYLFNKIYINLNVQSDFHKIHVNELRELRMCCIASVVQYQMYTTYILKRIMFDFEYFRRSMII